jgi:RNA polymerase sigma-70 factor (ECF subfamily)
MKGNTDQVGGPIPSLNHDAYFAECVVATSGWEPNKARPAHVCDEANLSDWGSHHLSIAPDDELLTKAQRGDQQAFVALCRRHSPMVKKRIVSIVRNQEDAEDALQDTLLRAYMHLSGFRRTAKFSTWLMRIGINTALIILRKRKTRKEDHTKFLDEVNGKRETFEYVDPSPDPEGLNSRRQIVLVLRREVQKLRPTLRSMVMQYYGAQCSVEESAKALEISVATAKSRLLRGRKTLRWSLGRRGVVDASI